MHVRRKRCRNRFLPGSESADAVLAAVAGESLAATCQQFVGICLVAYVPYQTVAGVSNT